MSTQSVSNDNFGPLIAYLVPGATVLAGVSPFSPTLQGWLAATPVAAPSIGGFLYATVASLAVGMGWKVKRRRPSPAWRRPWRCWPPAL